MNKLFKGINLFLTVSLILAALAIAFIALPIFGNQALIVRSGSMTPTIDVGSIVVVRPLTNESISSTSPTTLYGIGDIIAFRSEKNSKTIISHRIVGIEQNGNSFVYKTKGDANKSPEGWSVKQENVLGKVYFTLPQFGKLLAFSKSDLGFPALIILPAILVILLEALNIVKEIRKKKTPLRISLRSSSEGQEKTPEPVTNSSIVHTLVANGYHRIELKVLIIFLTFGMVIIPSTLALYADTEISQDNVFVAAAEFSTPTPTPGEEEVIVINEVFEASNSAEWVELFNPGGIPVDVSGWRITDEASLNTSEDILPSVTPIPPGGFAVIVTQGSTVTGSIPGSAITITLSNATIGSGLNSTGENVYLKSTSVTVIDQMGYGTANIFGGNVPASPPDGQSVRRIPNGIDTDVAGDFQNGVPTLGVTN